MKNSAERTVSPPQGGETRIFRLGGALAGTVNGLFGGGGGVPLMMLLTKRAGLDEKTAFATCVAVILPDTVTSIRPRHTETSSVWAKLFEDPASEGKMCSSLPRYGMTLTATIL